MEPRLNIAESGAMIISVYISVICKTAVFVHTLFMAVHHCAWRTETMRLKYRRVAAVPR